jgi:hypothetical protein
MVKVDQDEQGKLTDRHGHPSGYQIAENVRFTPARAIPAIEIHSDRPSQNSIMGPRARRDFVGIGRNWIYRRGATGRRDVLRRDDFF